MPVNLNVRKVKLEPVALAGEVALEELDLGPADELMRPNGPMHYDLVAEDQEEGILVRGRLSLRLDCLCARCLEPFVQECRVDDWACLLPWEGEDAVVVQNDCVDLTPPMREDIVLALPQRPLCNPECGGLPGRLPVSEAAPSAAPGPSPAWCELDKLKF